jgi:DNA-binding MarR family transcriptional regulator
VVNAGDEMAEEIGAHYERLGLSATAARVLGHLVMEPTGALDAPTLATRLGVAKSSLSVALATLERFGLVSRSRAPNSRRETFAVKDDAFEAVFLSKMPALQAFLDLADRASAVAAEGTDSKRRLERMRAFYVFMLEEFPALLERWDAHAATRDTGGPRHPRA